MPLVTKALLDLIRKRVEAHSTVVWFDPEKSYLDLARTLEPDAVAGAAVQRYDPERGFVWLRRQLESTWGERADPPRLLIYVPLAQADTHDALVEFEVAGAVVRPGQQPPEQNTALAAVARHALGVVFPPAALEEIVAQVEAGQLSLAELDQLAEKGAEAQTGAVAVIFGTGNVSEVALRFLSDPALDSEIEARQALASLAGLLSGALGVALPADQGATPLRAQLARQVLVTDLIEPLGDSVPQSLRTFAVAGRPVARQAAVDLAQAWRVRRDLAESYVHWAGRVQAEIGAGSLDLALDALARTETFAAGEVRLQREVETTLAKRPASRLVELAEARLGGFWSVQKPEIKARWEVVADAGRVLVEAARVESALKGKKWSAGALLSGYALGDQPWCELDTAQRHLERDFHRFELDVQQHESLIQLVAQSRQRYAAVSDHLADLFTRALAAGRFELPGVLLQADVYQEVVAPALKSGPVAYILVDALRFEMARELGAILEQDWKPDLTPALATPPTVTEIGMAALLPGAEGGLTVIPAEGNRLAAVIAGGTLKTRQDRLAHFDAVVEGNAVVARLDQLAPLSDTPLSRAIKSADVVVVTATEEIDGLCENNPALARRMLDDVLNQLRRAIKTLFALGIETVVISADHGYLFGEKLTTGDRIDAPGGKTAALKRRVWVGQGGAEAPALLRAPLSAFGIGGELEIATPWNLSCFKVRGGAMEYFHGGLSLPELVVPVLTVRPAVARAPAVPARVQWTLTPGSQTISTRFLSVTVEGRSEELLPIEPPAIRVEVRAGEQSISVPVSASYGFQEATRDVKLALDADEPRAIARNTVTLMITETETTPSVDEVTVHLLDATTGVSLARLDRVPFSISL
ncbi:MAG: PglZ domain-containing protein [Chloroflexota bacterium]|nr:PglZ domain-containing protein [Chloroflexota bacterium]